MEGIKRSYFVSEEAIEEAPFLVKGIKDVTLSEEGEEEVFFFWRRG